MATDPHSIEIKLMAGGITEAQNALAWGELVFSWINQPNTRPRTVQELRNAMANKLPIAVQGEVAGGALGGGRPVTVFPYTGAGIIIPIPTRKMIDDDRTRLVEIFNLGVGRRHYPLPAWYADIFGGAAKVDFPTQQAMIEMGLRRLGEYVVNECM